MIIFEQKYNFFNTRKMQKDGITYGYALPEHCRALAQLYSIATDGVADYYWSTVQKPGESLIDAGERLFSEDENFNYKNCIVACSDGRVIGMVLSFHMRINSHLPVDFSKVDPVLLPYKKLEIIDGFHCAALAVYPEYRKLRVGIHLITLTYEQTVGLGFNKLTHMVFAAKGQRVIDFWQRHMGYTLVAAEPVLANPYIKHTGEVLLFVKELTDDRNRPKQVGDTL